MESTQQIDSAPRECKTCGEAKPNSEYYTYETGGRTYTSKSCKDCKRQVTRTNAARVRATRRARRVAPRKTPGGMTIAERNRLWTEFKLARGCADCGRTGDAARLHFDHLPEFDKRFDISFAIHRASRYSDAEIEAEVGKCEVVCADCHVERTVSRLEPGETLPEWARVRRAGDDPREGGSSSERPVSGAEGGTSAHSVHRQAADGEPRSDR